MYQLHSLSQSRSLELSRAPVLPPCPSPAVLLFFSASPPSQWVLTACLNNSDSSSTELMVHQQQVKQQRRASPTRDPNQQAKTIFIHSFIQSVFIYTGWSNDSGLLSLVLGALCTQDYKSKTQTRAFSYTAAKLWISLLPHICILDTITELKTVLETHLFKLAYFNTGILFYTDVNLLLIALT